MFMLWSESATWSSSWRLLHFQLLRIWVVAPVVVVVGVSAVAAAVAAAVEWLIILKE